MNKFIRFIFVAPLIMVASLNSCGGGSSGNSSSGSEAKTVTGAPTGLQFTDSDGTAVTEVSQETKIQLRDTSAGVLIFDFSTSVGVNFANITATRSTTKSVVHFPSSSDKEGVSGTVTLYVPCTASQNAVVVCPGATSETEVSTSCTNGVTLSSATATASNYTFANAATRTGTTDCQITADIDNFGTGALATITLPSLTTADLNTTSPCPNQTLLTDATFLSDLKSATAMTLIFKNDSFETICALGDNFSATGVEEAAVTVTDFNLDGLLDVGIGVCGDDSSVDSIPKAGIYRRDVKVSANNRNYQLRFRTTLAAGSTDITGDPISTVLGSGTIESTIKYLDPAGSVISQDSTAQSTLIDFLPNPVNPFTVTKSSDNSTLFTTKVELICAVSLD